MSDDAGATPNGRPTGSGAEPAAPTEAPEPTATDPGASTASKDPLRGSRTSGIWAAVVGLGLVLLLLVVFIAQNTQTVNVTFLGWEGTAPLSVTLLVAAIAGLFLAVAAGTLRILQLRRRVRRDSRA
jgi:uncharacterized integral membrane protein